MKANDLRLTLLVTNALGQTGGKIMSGVFSTWKFAEVFKISIFEPAT